MKNVLVLIIFFLLFLSCDISGNTSTFLNEDSYIKSREKWQGFNFKNYSFDLVFASAASPTTYVVGVEIENSNLKERV